MRSDRKKARSIKRREFLQLSGAGAVATTATLAPPPEKKPAPAKSPGEAAERAYNGAYSGEHLSRVAFPLGGLGAGMLCFEGTGALSHVSLRNKPDVFHEPCVFAALGLKGDPASARVLEGPVPRWKLFGPPETGNGAGGKSYGLPRFASATFLCRFPFATVTLADPKLPLDVEITAWSPFEPGDADGSSLPVAGLEYRFHNRSKAAVESVFSWNAMNFMALKDHPKAVRALDGGFVLWGGAAKDKPWEEGSFCASVAEAKAKVNAAWFRGGWFDPLTLAWKDVAEAGYFDRAPVAEGAPSPGASLFVPLALAPGESRTVAVRLSWYVGDTDLRSGKDPAGTPTSDPPERFRPWYAGRFASVDDVNRYFADHYDALRGKAARFRDCFYDTSLPPELVEAVAANLTILKSPTVLRQTDGRLWAWEGCSDGSGCCSGSCTHVWNYAQALPHLFPDLERTLRETEFGPSQAETGHQAFRSALPIRQFEHDFHAAADGQLGGIMKVHRDWRISGDSEWLRRLWPRVRRSLDYCIATWDPGLEGVLVEPHHNTYDIEFWGPDGMCTSFYLGALHAAVAMGQALGDDVARYAQLFERGKARAETDLFDGEYFVQKVRWKDLRAGSPLAAKSMVGEYSPEARALLEKEGPKYQYGPGCLSDGVLGAWMAEVCGVGPVLDGGKVRSHLAAVHRHNLKRDLSEHANPQRPSFACGGEGGLLLCTWPKGGIPSLPFVYSNEVWTGIEYQVASHLMAMGLVDEGLEVVRVCRDRYDGRVRNPFNEYECGHWYARAMSSYALLQGLTGARYDAIEKVLYLKPKVRGDFRAFLAMAGGYGTVGVKNGKPFFEAAAGKPEIREIRYQA
jgi:uncharacterized protein (DUF608 family)